MITMCVITSELKAGQYRLLEFSGALPVDMRGQALINGVKYRTEIVYDMPNSIAVGFSTLLLITA